MRQPDHVRGPTRRQLIAGLAGAAAWSGCRAVPAPARSGDIASITHEVLWNGRERGTTWFHPRPCVLGPGEPPPVLMTMQSITGSDVFGPVHWTRTDDLGRTWTEPQPIDALGRREVGGGYEEGVCDVVPARHTPTGAVLALGHNVYYRAGKLARPYEDRYPVYVVGNGRGEWSARKRLHWEHPHTTGIYTAGCAQRLELESGELLLPVSFGPRERRDRGVTTLRCAFDGEELRVVARGSTLRLAVKRGLLEPSLARCGGRFYMTIRAEDGRGYVTTSPDGLTWQAIQPWGFDDGETLAMSTTQQHWLVHGEELLLVYTRRAAINHRVMRWRAPLWIARVDIETLRLVRDSERVVLPLVGDAEHAPETVARMGNFHTLEVTPSEAWVTVGETLPAQRWRGDLLLARIRWA